LLDAWTWLPGAGRILAHGAECMSYVIPAKAGTRS
jgi:hypothetical protein